MLELGPQVGEAVRGAFALGAVEVVARVLRPTRDRLGACPGLRDQRQAEGDSGVRGSHAFATQASPVIGFAADGFPIFGSYIQVGGQLRKARSSYQLKTGQRTGGPRGQHDGTFVDDWVYVPGSGDLDECNGMRQDGAYGYVITETYPHVMACFKGTPDESFRKRRL